MASIAPRRTCVRSLAPIVGLLCGIACASTPTLKAGGPAHPDAAPAPSPPFVVEVRADSLMVGGKVTLASEPAIKKALKRELKLSPSAVLRAEAGANRETFAFILGRLRSKADRVWFEHRGEKLDVSNFYPDEARIDWLTLSWETSGPTLTFWDAVKRGSIEPVVWQFDDRKSELAVLKLVGEHCQNATCRIALAVEGAASVSDIAAALEALTALRERQKVQFDVLSTALPHSPVELKAGEEPKVASRSAGRLPPEMIQSTISSRSNLFRACYSAGLERNRRLEGFISVRFVITQDGKVLRPERAAARLSDEQMIQCLIAAFAQLRFPESPTGIVTVVYPIHFVR
jgi:hypothetical protein